MINLGLCILPGLTFTRAGPSAIVTYLLAGIGSTQEVIQKEIMPSYMWSKGLLGLN